MRLFKKSFALIFCIASIGLASLSLNSCAKEEHVGDFYYKIKDDNTAAVYVESYTMSELIIPETINGLRVSTIMKPKKSSKLNTTLTNIVFPESLKIIDKKAFKGCIGIEELNLPSGLLEIGENAFESCSSLTSVRLPYGITTLGEEAFKNCSGLKEFYIPATMETVGAFVFEGCFDLEVYAARESAPNFFSVWNYYWLGDAKVHWGYNDYEK